jgi:tetratricopeptide (TPR) repeat protein
VVDSGGTGHRLGFEATVTIRRKDFGIVGPPDMNRLTALGQLTIGDEVDLTLNVLGWIYTPTKLDRPADSLHAAIVKRGIDAVVRGYRDARASTPDSLMAVDERALNIVGYHLLRLGKHGEAVKMFALEAETFPKSPYAQVGLAQALATAGDRERAIESCEKALAIDPQATRALEILRRLRPS